MEKLWRVFDIQVGGMRAIVMGRRKLTKEEVSEIEKRLAVHVNLFDYGVPFGYGHAGVCAVYSTSDKQQAEAWEKDIKKAEEDVFGFIDSCLDEEEE